MKVSIITVCYNSASTIRDTIESVINQTYADIEYIVLDGASTDNTVEIINQYKSSIQTFISEKDNGMYDAINKGIKIATGDIIGILNSDDFYINNQIINKVANIFMKQDIEGIYGDLIYVDPVNTSKVIRKWVSGKYVKGAFLKGWMPPHPTFFVKKEVYNKYGLFNLQLSSAADYELMLRFIHKNNLKLGYLPENMVKMRTGGKSNISIFNRLKGNKEDRKAWKINNLKVKWYTLILKPLSKIKQYF